MHIAHFVRFGLVVALFLFVSCSGQKTEPLHLDISIRNDTQIALDWMKIEWDGPYIPGGILAPGVSTTAIGVELPKSDVATLSFVEDVGRQPHSIRLDVSHLKRLHSGRHEAVLSVVSLTEAKLLIDGEDK